MHAVDEIDVGKPSRLEHPPIPRRDSAKGVAGAIGGSVVRLDLDQPAAEHGPVGPLAAEHTAQQVARDGERGSQVERRIQTT